MKIINMTPAWNKEKSLSPRRESNPWSPEHRADIYYSYHRAQNSPSFILFLELFSLSVIFYLDQHISVKLSESQRPQI